MIEFFTESNFDLAHKVTDCSLTGLFLIATIMIIVSFCKLTTYFEFFLPVQDERKMNISAGFQIGAYCIMTGVLATRMVGDFTDPSEFDPSNMYFAQYFITIAAFAIVDSASIG